MNRRIIYASTIVVVLMIGASGILFLFEYLKFQKSVSLLDEALRMVNAGQYQEGLEKCDQIPYRRGICYTAAFARKLHEQEPVTVEFCESIPTNDKEPFWISNREEYPKELLDIKKNCTQIALANRTTIFIQ